MTESDNENLSGIEAISKAGGFSKPQFYYYLSINFPARKIFGTWRASRTNINKYFRELTAGRGQEITEEDIPKKNMSR